MENIKLGDLYLSKKESSNKKIFKKQSKDKKRIDNIREDLKDLSYKLSKSELKEIKTNLYNIEKSKKKLTQKTLVNI